MPSVSFWRLGEAPLISVFDLFKIGVGPSSSHTVGPMKAAAAFADALAATNAIARVAGVQRHALRLARLHRQGPRDRQGDDPRLERRAAGNASIPTAPKRWSSKSPRARRLRLAGRRPIAFDPATDIVFDVVNAAAAPPQHAGVRARDAAGAIVAEERWLSIGGGFIQREDEEAAVAGSGAVAPYPFADAAELLKRAAGAGMTIAELMRANEPTASGAVNLDARLDGDSRGDARRDRSRPQARGAAAGRARRSVAAPRRSTTSLSPTPGRNARAAHEIMDYVAVYAMAVNEENAAGGRVVTAPTNGAAGVMPAVLRYYRDHCAGATPEGLRVMLLTAAAIGALFKMNASISGAEVGCQGEVGVASSMAAAGLCAALGGANAQIENAAEIAMEHHLGMTCDPIGGLVQIPCIERNAFGAIKAIAAASLALARRRPPQGVARQRHRDYASDRRRHAVEIQGDLARRAGGEFHRVLRRDAQSRSPMSRLSAYAAFVGRQRGHDI